jgi:hypothetical protein
LSAYFYEGWDCQLGKHRSSRKNTSLVSVSLLIYPHLPCLHSLSLILHLLLNECCHFFSLHIRREELDDLALRVDEKLGEVPGDDLGCLGDGIIEGAVVAQVGENRVSVLSIYLHLLHDREASLEVVLDEGVNLLRGATLLSEELVARESQDFKATAAQLLMNPHHLLVVVRSQASLAGYIDHHDQLPISKRLEAELLPVDVLDYEVEEGGWHRLRQAFGAGLEDQLLYQTSHQKNRLNTNFTIRINTGRLQTAFPSKRPIIEC